MTTALIYDPIYLEHDTGHHPESASRLEAIIAALESDEIFWTQLLKLEPSTASDQDITRCHSARLLDQVHSMCDQGVRALDLDTRISAESFDVSLKAAGALLTAVDGVITGDCNNAFALVRPPGHHATPDRAMGFCLFNNAAVAARYAQSRYGVGNVLIIDWDVHHGNGTQDIFYEDPTVYYFSTHQYPHYPGTGMSCERGGGKGEGSTLNIPLSGGTAARSHREAFREGLKLIEENFSPDLLIISAGFDSRRGDPLGGLMLEDTDFAEMTKEVMELAHRHAGGHVVSVLEGGYNLQTLGNTVKAHVESLMY